MYFIYLPTHPRPHRLGKLQEIGSFLLGRNECVVVVVVELTVTVTPTPTNSPQPQPQTFIRFSTQIIFSSLGYSGINVSINQPFIHVPTCYHDIQLLFFDVMALSGHKCTQNFHHKKPTFDIINVGKVACHACK